MAAAAFCFFLAMTQRTLFRSGASLEAMKVAGPMTGMRRTEKPEGLRNPADDGFWGGCCPLPEVLGACASSVPLLLLLPLPGRWSSSAGRVWSSLRAQSSWCEKDDPKEARCSAIVARYRARRAWYLGRRKDGGRGGRW